MPILKIDVKKKDQREKKNLTSEMWQLNFKMRINYYNVNEWKGINKPEKTQG